VAASAAALFCASLLVSVGVGLQTLALSAAFVRLRAAAAGTAASFRSFIVSAIVACIVAGAA
jgi:hypothetical protein